MQNPIQIFRCKNLNFFQKKKKKKKKRNYLHKTCYHIKLLYWKSSFYGFLCQRHKSISVLLTIVKNHFKTWFNEGLH